MLKRVQHDKSGGRGLPPAPFPFAPISCNNVAMTSSSSQTSSTADPTARVEAILAELQNRFRAAVSALKSAIAAYAHDGTLPPADAASTGLFDYPALRLVTDGVLREGQGHNLAFGRFEHAGEFVTTVTRPDLFEDYLRAQFMRTEEHTSELPSTMGT